MHSNRQAHAPVCMLYIGRGQDTNTQGVGAQVALGAQHNSSRQSVYATALEPHTDESGTQQHCQRDNQLLIQPD